MPRTEADYFGFVPTNRYELLPRLLSARTLAEHLHASDCKFSFSNILLHLHLRMHSYTEENYLKALFNLANEKGEVGPNELSKQLAIKMPTVNSMMKKLADKKLVYYESYKPLRLTEKGKKEAGLIIRKHRLTEMFLVQKMGFGWENVHEIAEQVEHIHSPDFFQKMDELLGFPKI